MPGNLLGLEARGSAGQLSLLGQQRLQVLGRVASPSLAENARTVATKAGSNSGWEWNGTPQVRDANDQHSKTTREARRGRGAWGGLKISPISYHQERNCHFSTKEIASFKEQQNYITFKQPQHLSKTKWAFGPYQTSLCSDSVYLNLEQWFLNGKNIYIVTIKGQKPVKIPNLNFQD